MSYSTALQIVHYVAETNQPDEDDLDDLPYEVLEVVARQEEALEAIEGLLKYFSCDLDAIPRPEDLNWPGGLPSTQAIEVDEVDDRDGGSEIDFSDPFFAIQLGLLMASSSIRPDDELVDVDEETLIIAKSAIRMVEHLMNFHRDAIVAIATQCRAPRTLN